MSEKFLRTLDDIKEEQEAILEREMDPDMALLSDYIVGELTDEQEAQVRARIQKDPDFRDLATPLLLAADHGARPSPMPRADLDRKWLELRRRIGLPELGAAPGPQAGLNAFRRQLKSEKRSAYKRIALGFAALLLLTVLPPAIIMYRDTIGGYTGTDWGRTEVVSMPDGSRATLAMGTQLVRVSDAGSNEREYVLKGEADFNVVPNGSPFVVYTQSAVITVTGTKFNVHAYLKEPTILSVQEGSVRVQSRNAGSDALGPDLNVKAGQRARIVNGYPAEIIP